MKTKNNIPGQNSENDNLSPLLKTMKLENSGLKVPEGYFDSLSPRIVDSINDRQSRKVNVPVFRKSIVWAPVLATITVAVLLIFVIPAKKNTTIPATDEWAEINMAYDASYAEEALFAEGYSIDNELEKSDLKIESVSLSKNNEPTDEEITEYLKDQDLDLDMITEY
jgi:hypothetical protein